MSCVSRMSSRGNGSTIRPSPPPRCAVSCWKGCASPARRWGKADGMLGFDPTPEQEALREMAHKFAVNEIRPRAAEGDRDGAFPRELVRKAFDLGLMTGFIPEAYGGQGLSSLDTCFLEEELAWGCSGVTTSMTANGLALGPILLAGTEEQKRSFVAPFATEFRPTSFCLPERGAGSDAGGIGARAARRGGPQRPVRATDHRRRQPRSHQYTVFAS